MIRGRRSLRNIGKSAAECRERLNRVITDDDWECSSDEEIESDGEAELEPNQADTSASTRSSVKRVASVIAKFDEKKRELVKSIGFGGLLELNQINKVSRKFTVWLLSRLDTENRTIDVNGEIQVEMVDFDVNRILGIPCGPRQVTPLANDDAKQKKIFMQQLIGAAANETNSLVAAGHVVTKDYGDKMSKKQCDNFKVSFVVFVVGHLLAPTTKNNVGNRSFWGALTLPDEISQYNWGEYVLEQLVEAAVKVQADIRKKKKISNITGCSVLLQIMYLETLNIPGLQQPKDVYPRIKAYTCGYLRKLIEADKASSSSGSRNPTWGSTIGCRLPTINRPNNEKVLLKKLEKAGDMREQLTEFAKDNFSGKMTETHINALIAYGERCATHFSTLKESLMKENMFLVEMLMCGRVNPPKQNIVNDVASYGGSIDVRKDAHPDMRALRGYDSECGGTRRSSRIPKRASSSYHGIEDLLTGVAVGRELGTPTNIGIASSSASMGDLPNPVPAATDKHVPSFDLGIEIHSQYKLDQLNKAQESSQEVMPVNKVVAPGVHDPPSFDLGIDFQDQDRDAEGSQEAVTRALPCGSKIVNPGMGFISLGHTPASGKRKNEAMSWTSPDQRFKSSTTSPASMSKILADGAVFARIIRSEDELDINIQPWDHDTTNSPVTKLTIDNCRLAKSPWFHGLSDKLCGREIAENIWEQVMTIGHTELERSWIIHRSPRFLKVSGVCIKDSFTLKEPFDYDLYDLALRRIVQLDSIMYEDANSKCWRHIFESDFAVLAQADEKPAYHKTIREQFFGPGVKHKLNKCRMFVIPAQVLRNWCCYFWDFKTKMIHIVDPLYNEEQSSYYQKLHGPIVDKICAELANCIELFFEKWTVNWAEWHQQLVIPKIRLRNANDSAFLSLMSIKEFDGEGFKNITEVSFEEFKKVLLAEMLSIDDNLANPPVKCSIGNVSSPIIHDIDDD